MRMETTLPKLFNAGQSLLPGNCWGHRGWWDLLVFLVLLSYLKALWQNIQSPLLFYLGRIDFTSHALLCYPQTIKEQEKEREEKIHFLV